MAKQGETYIDKESGEIFRVKEVDKYRGILLINDKTSVQRLISQKDLERFYDKESSR